MNQPLPHNTPLRDRHSKRRTALISATGVALAMLAAATAAAQDATTLPATMPATMPAMAPATMPAMVPAMTPSMTPAATPAMTPADTTAAQAPPSLLVASGLGLDGAIKLLAGHSDVITTKAPVKRVSVAQPDVADVNLIAPGTVLLTAKKAGATQLILWNDQEQSQVVEVYVELDVTAAQRQLKEAFPGTKLELSALNDSIAVRGLVPSTLVAEQVMEMAASFGKVHNFLEIGGGQQVMLQVRFAEVSKSATRSLGVTFGGTDGVSSFSQNTFTGASNAFTGILSPTGTVAGTAATAGSGVSIFGQGRFGVVAFDYFISALANNGLVRTLAEPNVMAISGQQASFLAGGQVPIPVPQAGTGGSAVITIQYHDYGVHLNFLPMVLGNGKVRLKVMPEVSDLDFSNSVSINGTSVPGFTDRKVETTAELADGQSMALAGLLNNKSTANKSAIPLLGDLPVIGALFRSVSYQRNETELVILITPRLVEPLNPDETPALPGEHWREPTDLGLYALADLGGPIAQSQSSSTDRRHAGPPPRFHGVYGFTPAASGSVVPSK